MQIQRAVSRYKPIETCGLTLYPVLVREYETLLLGRPALEVMHQSLPVAMMRVPLLSALYQIDFQAVMQGETPTGLFSRSLVCLALALRLADGGTIEQMVRQFEVAVDPNDPARLMRLRFSDANGESREITPAQYSELRKIIAAQNGIKIESDKANPDIVRAEKLKAAATDIHLDIHIEDWISAISALSGVAEEEIDEWPILKFQRRSDSYQRILSYVVCGVGECSGTTWKDGNPSPHPFFAKMKNGSGILTEMGGSADGTKPTPPEAASAIRTITQKL